MPLKYKHSAFFQKDSLIRVYRYYSPTSYPQIFDPVDKKWIQSAYISYNEALTTTRNCYDCFNVKDIDDAELALLL